MIIVYGGCHVDQSNQVSGRIRGLFQSLKPKGFVGSLAPGADMLFAEAALTERGKEDFVEFLLPFDNATFREKCVAPAGQPWASKFGQIIAAPGVNLGHAALNPVDAEVGQQHNIALLDKAEALGRLNDQRVWVIAVRPKPDPSSPTVTDDLMTLAEQRNMLAIDLDPAPSAAPRAFIVMPYGKKRDPRANKNVQCDPSFHRVYRPLLEDFDVEWTRADLQTDSGIIHAAMLSDLANCDLVLGDLTASNFNVGYELGIRHVFAPRATVLINPAVTNFKYTSPPFDLSMSRAHKFSRGADDVSDADAEAAIRALRPVIETALAAGENDSPCHEWFNLDSIKRPVKSRAALPGFRETQRSVRERVATAAQSADPEKMLAEAKALGTAAISDEARRACRIELAAALLNEGASTEAMELLELAKPEDDPAKPPEDDPLRRIWFHKTVMAYRNTAESSDDPDQKRELRQQAKRYLAEAEAAGYRDSETYGIWGGLLKRQIEDQRGQMETVVAQSLFAEMADKYWRGFTLDPEYYTGVNVVMALRWSGRPKDDAFARDFNEVLTVSRFLAKAALTEDERDFWAAVTLAELTLHEALERRTASVDDAVRQYADAARAGRPAQITSALYQIEFLRACGDDPAVLDRVRTALEQGSDVRSQ
jgi:hypothetical protein